MRGAEERPIMSIIDKIKPASTGDLGNITAVYTLDVEGRKIYGRGNMGAFYAPQMQKRIKIKHVTQL